MRTHACTKDFLWGRWAVSGAPALQSPRLSPCRPPANAMRNAAESSAFGLPAVAPHCLAGLCPAPRLSPAESSENKARAPARASFGQPSPCALSLVPRSAHRSLRGLLSAIAMCIKVARPSGAGSHDLLRRHSKQHPRSSLRERGTGARSGILRSALALRPLARSSLGTAVSPAATPPARLFCRLSRCATLHNSWWVVSRLSIVCLVVWV